MLMIKVILKLKSLKKLLESLLDSWITLLTTTWKGMRSTLKKRMLKMTEELAWVF